VTATVARARPRRPIIIAHRGASGYLPEHTLAGKALAYGMGADFLEQDVVATADRQAIVFHDLVLDHTTDVRERYPGRARGDGLSYAVDFSLAEIRELRICERRVRDSTAPRWPGRFAGPMTGFRVTTLAEELTFIGELNRQTGRSVGAYIEVKRPRWHQQQGIDLSRLVLECLEQAGWESAIDQVYLQCFDFEEIRRLRDELATPLPLIQLLSTRTGSAAESNFEWLGSRPGLEQLAHYAAGIGPAYGQLIQDTPGTSSIEPSPLFVEARALGLLIHPYTFRADELPGYAESFERLLELFLHDLAVDGIFCDFPDRAARVRDQVLR